MAGAFDVEHIPVNKTNLGVTLLSSAISSSTETITVDSATILPAAKFYATITPAGGISDSTNSEIILVRSVSGITLTVTRGVRGTTAKAFDAGSVLFNGVYYQDSPYDASEILTTQNETYTDVQGLLAAINDGRPVIMNQYYGTSDLGGQVIMTSATLTNMPGLSQTITIRYIMDERLVTVDISPTTGAITRSGVNVATSGNKIITGSMIRNNTITSDNVDWKTFIDKIYPVGSIYMSATMSTAEQVHSALGGTWVKWGAGRVPVGVDPSQTEFDTVEETGGEKNHTLI